MFAYSFLKNLVRSKNLKGSGLIYGLGVLVVLSIIFTGLIIFVVSTVRYSLQAEPREEALHVAEAGLYAYRWYVARNIDGRTAKQVREFWEDTVNPPRGSAGADGVCDGVDDNGPYEEDYYVDGVKKGSYSLCVVIPTDGESAAFVESTGSIENKPGKERVVRMRLRRPPWSEFAILANAEIEISSGTSVNGGVHSNNGIRVEGPVAGLVSSGVSTYNYGGNTQDGVWTNTVPESSVFLEGTSFPTPTQDFNSVVASFAELQAKSEEQYTIPTKAGGQGWHLIFKADGTADLYWVKKYNRTTKALSYKPNDWVFEQTLTLGDSTAIYVRNDLWVEGVIDSGKQVTVGAHHTGGGRNHDIFINGDITYEDQVSETILGLAAERDIEVIEDPDTGADNVLDIHGALLAQTGRVGRSAYAGAPLQNLKVLGAIATFQDFGFLKTTNAEIEYDTNFLFNAPPFFPTGGSYVIDRWSELE